MTFYLIPCLVKLDDIPAGLQINVHFEADDWDDWSDDKKNDLIQDYVINELISSLKIDWDAKDVHEVAA